MLDVKDSTPESQLAVQASAAESAPAHAITIEPAAQAPAQQPIPQTNQSSLVLPPRLLSTPENTHRVQDMEGERDDEANDALYSFLVNGNVTMDPQRQFAQAGPTRFLEIGDVNDCMAVAMTGTRGEARTPVAAFAHLSSHEYENNAKRSPNYERLKAFREGATVTSSMAATNDGGGVGTAKKPALRDVPVFQTAAGGSATYLLDATTGAIHLRGPKNLLAGGYEVGERVQDLDRERRNAARERAAPREHKADVSRPADPASGSAAPTRRARPEKPWIEWKARGPKFNCDKCCEGDRCGNCSKCCPCTIL